MLYAPTKENIKLVSQFLNSGEVVAIPTETVYGLAANALNATAVKKIFEVKGRPADNPLIVHIANLSDIEKYAYINDTALLLAKTFWPGPLTFILKKKDIIPSIVSGGLDSIALRFPSHPIAQEIIRISGLPLAAPSANISGRPSPTKAQHVIDDFGDKIKGVVDGGLCNFGVESTVISLLDEKHPALLRPGFVTPKDLSKIISNIEISPGVFKLLDEDIKPLSPGLKHKHYSPKTRTIGVSGSSENAARFINNQKECVVICFNDEVDLYNCDKIMYGKKSHPEQNAARLFAALREADLLEKKIVYIRVFVSDGIGLAVYNRLLRATNFTIINADKVE